MSNQLPDNGFAPIDDSEHAQPLGPTSRRARDKKGGGCLKGCLVTLGVLAVLAVISVYACGKVVERSVVEEPAEVERAAQEVAQYVLPPGFSPKGALRLPVLGQIAIFARSEDGGSQQATAAIGRLEVELDEKDLLEAMGQASGQGTRNAEVKSQPCEVAGRRALCFDATTTAEDSELRVRWHAVLVSSGKGAAVAAYFDDEKRIDELEARAFIGSFRPRTEER